MTNDIILVAEDNPDDEEFAVRALTRAKLEASIVVVWDGAEAADFILNRAHPSPVAFAQRIRVVLLDLKLPTLSGLEVLARLRACGVETPIVLFSSSDLPSDVAEAYRLGANSFVTKPMAPEQYTRAIRELGTYWLVHNRPSESTLDSGAPV